ncbi:substrate-binding domain-containing protein [uncultured Corynebacterium sp.]|uniref:substrate-binding domain-containing protein n=1 Tax=uncultured Corynebacterium sp. TaxID=159447 RepID=UPI002598AF7D|nr:substrate-binding domain-containing protein [uncultured Corynebacterium sp.]
MRKTLAAALAAATALTLGACAGSGSGTGSGSGAGEAFTITGSSTVEPITRYMLNRYNFDAELEAVGSTDGFDKFCAGDADINDASVAIPGSESSVDYQAQCAEAGVDFFELPIGLDAITIVKHADNDWATDLTVEQLHDIWSKESTVTTWSDIDPSWPNEKINLYGRPTGSGTLGVFEDMVLGNDTIRDDYQSSDDIQELSTWVSEDVNGLSFMGIGNYLATEGTVRNKIDNVLVDGIAPTADEAKSGNYPLSRPLFIYVNAESAKKDNVGEFVTTYLDNAEAVMPRVYFYQLPEEVYDATKQRFADGTTGIDEQWHALN